MSDTEVSQLKVSSVGEYESFPRRPISANSWVPDLGQQLGTLSGPQGQRQDQGGVNERPMGVLGGDPVVAHAHPSGAGQFGEECVERIS